PAEWPPDAPPARSRSDARSRPDRPPTSRRISLRPWDCHLLLLARGAPPPLARPAALEDSLSPRAVFSYNKPSACINSAFRTDAPAAPRIVLGPRAMTFADITGHGRMRPTETAIPPERLASSR